MDFSVGLYKARSVLTAQDNVVLFTVVQVVPIVKRHGVQLMLCGHDHNLQHIQSVDNPNEVNYFISGAGGRGLYALNQDNADYLSGRGLAVGYFGFTHGFSYLEFSATAATVSNIDSNGFVAYRYTRGVSTAAPGSA
jgi:tartrate-resistant acid phosphatase type 5